MEFPDLELGELKGSEEQTLAYYQERFDIATRQVEAVKSKIESNTNKGSFLMKVLHLKETLHAFDAIGDFESLYIILDKLHTELNEYIEANRQKNLDIKTALLEELRPVVESHDWKVSSALVKEIQGKWLKTGAVANDKKEEIEEAFKSLTQRFYERRSSFYSDLEKMSEEKEAAFVAFLKKSKNLKSLKDIGELRKAISVAKKEWHALGKIKPSRHNEFWQEFQSIIKAALAEAKKADRAKAKVSPEDNEKAKQSIISELEKANESILPSINLNAINKRWKSVGTVDKQSAQELTAKYLRLTGMVSEKKFLNTLVEKKAKEGAGEAELNKLRIRLVRGLLDRDYNELKTFEENLGKFNMASGLDNLLERKLAQQKLKVEIKKDILTELKKLG